MGQRTTGLRFRVYGRQKHLTRTLTHPTVPMAQRLLVCTLNVCNPRFLVPNTLVQGHIPWFRGPNPKGTKDNSLNGCPELQRCGGGRQSCPT